MSGTPRNGMERFILQLAEATSGGAVRWERLTRGYWGTGREGRTILYRAGDEPIILVADPEGSRTRELEHSTATAALGLVLREREREGEEFKRGVGAALAGAGVDGVDAAIGRAIGLTESGKLDWRIEPHAVADMRVSLLARVRFDIMEDGAMSITLHRPWSRKGPSFTRYTGGAGSPSARLARLAFTRAVCLPWRATPHAAPGRFWGMNRLSHAASSHERH